MLNCSGGQCRSLSASDHRTPILGGLSRGYIALPDLTDEYALAQGGRAGAPEGQGVVPWLLLAVSVDETLHDLARSALSDIRFQGRPLDVIGTASAQAAQEHLANHPETALILLDADAESEGAGLRLVRAIREDLDHHAVRIIVRAGTAGQAAEDRIVLDYDVNDYRPRAELTAQRLRAVVIAALRSYADIIAIDKSRRALRRMIALTGTMRPDTRLPRFAEAIMRCACDILEIPMQGLVYLRPTASGDGEADADALDGFELLLNWPPQHPGKPNDATCPAPLCAEALDPADPTLLAALCEALRRGEHAIEPTRAILYLCGPNGLAALVCLRPSRPLNAMDAELLAVLASQMGNALTSIALYGQLAAANADLRRLAETLEGRVAERTQELKIANEQLDRLASIDGLTGIFNRRRFMEIAQAERGRAIRYHRSFSILLMDLDHFKRINDTHGHAAGDAAIRQAVECMTDGLRSTDTLARFGGEEFVALLPETPLDAAIMVGERIRKALLAKPVRHAGLTIAFTVSIGVAEWKGETETLAHLLHRADQALYQAKRQGRNMTEASD
jgi:two-component system, cell cycle response regulator